MKKWQSQSHFSTVALEKCVISTGMRTGGLLLLFEKTKKKKLDVFVLKNKFKSKRQNAQKKKKMIKWTHHVRVLSSAWAASNRREVNPGGRRAVPGCCLPPSPVAPKRHRRRRHCVETEGCVCARVAGVSPPSFSPRIDPLRAKASFVVIYGGPDAVSAGLYRRHIRNLFIRFHPLFAAVSPIAPLSSYGFSGAARSDGELYYCCCHPGAFIRLRARAVRGEI